MRNDRITFGKSKDKYWEDVIFSDRSYVEWVAENYQDVRMQEIAKYWLDKILEDADITVSQKNLKNIVEHQDITKNSEEYIVKLLGKDDARQLALNIFALTEA